MSCYEPKKKVTEHFILQLLHKQRLFLYCSSRSNGSQKQCLKYFQILTGAIPLLQQPHLKILHKGGLCHCPPFTDKKPHCIVEMTCSRPPKHASARAGYRARFPSSKSAPQLALVASRKRLLVCTKNMCFAFKREWILQTKHLGGGEMEKLLTEVHSCTDIILLLAPIFHTAFFIC